MDNGPDNKGRRLEDFWEKGNILLELSHNYIQWLFPLTTKSEHNSQAPVLTDEDIKILSTNAIAKKNMIRSLMLMLRFYGLEIIEYSQDNIEISPIDDSSANCFEIRSRYWLRKENHNYLRITRIMKSLRLFGLDIYAEALFKCLCNIYGNTKAISEKTFVYWKKAMDK